MNSGIVSSGLEGIGTGPIETQSNRIRSGGGGSRTNRADEASPVFVETGVSSLQTSNISFVESQPLSERQRATAPQGARRAQSTFS